MIDQNLVIKDLCDATYITVATSAIKVAPVQAPIIIIAIRMTFNCFLSTNNCSDLMANSRIK